jgi:hypothetical protein
VFFMPPCMQYVGDKRQAALSSRVHGLSAGTEVWHARLGHLGLDNMALMMNREMVDGFDLTKKELEETRRNPSRFCEPCVMANAKRAPSPTSKSPPTTRMLQLLHTDLAGPYETTSFNDKKYVLTVLDDYSKLSSIKCLKHKDDVQERQRH